MKHRTAKTSHHLGFIDLEKTYHLVPRPKLEYNEIPKGLAHPTSGQCKTRIEAKTAWGKTNSVAIRLDLQQGSTLSPLIFMKDDH